MKQRDLGLNIDQTLVLETFVKFGPPGSDSVFLRTLDFLKEKLLSNPNIAGVTASYDIPGKEHLSLFPTFRNIKNSENMVSLYYSRIDHDFIPLFDVDIIAGRNFSNSTQSDESAIVINMEALETLGFENAEQAVGYEVSFGRGPTPRKVTVIGVVDFRANSFKEKNLPVVYQTIWAPLRFLSIKMNNVTSFDDEIQFVEKQWRSHFPDLPFNYFFLDEYFNRQYQADQKLSTILTLFTSLSVVIACLGLYGLASIVAAQRTREIGIRKVLGASVRNLFFMLSKDFGVMLLLATIIASPAVWYAVTKWLDHYFYRTEISWWVFVLPLFGMAIIMLVTVGQHALRAALINPVDSLRDD
jgi:putative ABC transport system permease protein